MAKNIFSRSNVKSSILKKIIIRVDFIGLTDLLGCVNRLKAIMDGKFTKFSPINNNNYNVNLNSPLNNNLVNVNLEKKTLYQFTDCKIGPSNANFMLGPNFAYIEINSSDNYEGCNEYIWLMANVIDSIRKFDSFISIQRLGLRKVDIARFKDDKELSKSVEKSIWETYKNSSACFPLKKVYSDLIFQRNVQTVFNIQRIVQEIEVDGSKEFQFVFDIDSYKNDNLINSDDLSTVERIEDMISKQMNEPIFNYFIDTFTEQYIDNFYHG